MDKYQQKFVVQNLETYEFIYPDEIGDISFTPNIKSAGRYDNYEDAFMAGLDEIGGEFQIFGFYEKV